MALVKIGPHGRRLSQGGDAMVSAQQQAMTRLEAVHFFIDPITIFARNTLHSRLARQMATSVIALFLSHFGPKLNKIRQESRPAETSEKP
ncbi:MAG: hypothetical protein ABSA83_02550 [Verrucomicrobiota bacterium]|jgi:hypothetical protein